MMGESTDPGPRVSPVIRDAPVVCQVLTELLTLLDTLHAIVHTVHCLEQHSQAGLVLAHPALAGLGAVVLQVEHLLGPRQLRRPRHSAPVLPRQSAPGTGRVVTHGPARRELYPDWKLKLSTVLFGTISCTNITLRCAMGR